MFNSHNKKIQEGIRPLIRALGRASLGDNSVTVAIPEEENDLTELLVAVNLLLHELKGAEKKRQEAEEVKMEAALSVEREKIKILKEEAEKLEKMVKDRTQELVESHKKIEDNFKEISRLKDEFVFVAAHELKAPVGVIKSYLAEITEDKKLLIKLKKASPYLAEIITELSSAKDRLSNLVTDLLNVARMEAGRVRVEKQDVNIIKMAGALVKSLSSLGKGRKISLVFKADDVPENIFIDPDRYAEILTNLVTNAIKYNRDKGKVSVRLAMSQGRLKTEVEDTGIGLSEEEQKHMFEKFWRSGEKKEAEGTGLGLFIVKHILEQMNGNISLHSTKGVGSTFVFDLPATK